ncbi:MULTISPECIES: helix-hairpin-helix domain-containing protein [unclassified Acidovorax]|uniref:ComEA family DNA-binding protein n=1 Tax=unclassified Acidovorax TaxID=2684926 RepID=UPI002882EDF3|nr:MULTISPECIES: helix-hairpin-helix domain-containing protein [unclassified Acidovorax]
MFKTITAMAAMLWAAAAFAAVDVNQASEAQLDAVKGIGPAVSGRILAERSKAPFKDWQDLITRVQGVGPGSAAKFSAEGLTLNGSAYQSTPATPAAAKR